MKSFLSIPIHGVALGAALGNTASSASGASQSSGPQPGVCDVRDFGAKGDGVILSLVRYVIRRKPEVPEKEAVAR